MPISRRSILLSSAGSILSAAITAGCGGRSKPGSRLIPSEADHPPTRFQDISPRWSPDGSKIAFLRQFDNRSAQLFVASADLSEIEALLPPELLGVDRPIRTSSSFWMKRDGLAWHPNGAMIAYPKTAWLTQFDGEQMAGQNIFAVGVQDKKSFALAAHIPGYSGAFPFYRSISWSPDGASVSFVGEAFDGRTALYVVRSAELTAASGQVTMLPRFDPGADTDWPCWSPSQGRFAYRVGILRAASADRYEHLRFETPGGLEAGTVLRISPDIYRSLTGIQMAVPVAPRVLQPAWAPEGDKIAFALSPDASRAERSEVWLADLMGNPPRRVTGPGHMSPVWIDGNRLGILKKVREEWEIGTVTPKGRQGTYGSRIPSDDLDWLPGEPKVVCSGPPTAVGSIRTTLVLADATR